MCGEEALAAGGLLVGDLTSYERRACGGGGSSAGRPVAHRSEELHLRADPKPRAAPLPPGTSPPAGAGPVQAPLLACTACQKPAQAAGPSSGGQAFIATGQARRGRSGAFSRAPRGRALPLLPIA